MYTAVAVSISLGNIVQATETSSSFKVGVSKKKDISNALECSIFNRKKYFFHSWKEQGCKLLNVTVFVKFEEILSRTNQIKTEGRNRRLACHFDSIFSFDLYIRSIFVHVSKRPGFPAVKELVKLQI